MSTLRTDTIQTTDSSYSVSVKDIVTGAPITIAQLKLLPKGTVPRIVSVKDSVNGINEDYYIDLNDTTSPNNNAMVVVANDGGRWKVLDKRYQSGEFYTTNGAFVHKMGDRVQMGDAVRHDAGIAMDQPDWFTTYMRSKGREYAFLTSATVGITNSLNNNASNTMVVASHSKDLLPGWNCIGLIAIGVGNNTSGTGHSYAGYFEAYRDVGVSGGAYGIEIDTINYASLANTDPYVQPANQTIGLQIASGGEFSSTGQVDSSAAINIRKNGSKFYRGIVFGSDALTGSDGVTGTSIAIALAKGQKMQWYSGVDSGTSAIFCSGDTASQSMSQEFSNNLLKFNAPSGLAFSVGYTNTSVNYVAAQAQNSGLPAQLLAKGADTTANVDLQLVPQASGYIWTGPHTAGVLSPTGFVTMKDSSGVLRRFMVG